MNRYVAFLRGMNLGKRRLAMSRLRELFEELEMAEVETFIASGNVLFSSKEKDTAKLEARIAKRLEESLGYAVDTFIRSAAEVVAIGQARVFPDQGREGVTVHIGFLHEELPAHTAQRLRAIRSSDDEFEVKGRAYYWLCRVRTSDSKIWRSPEMKALKLPSSSMRNLSSIRKLIARHLA